MRRIALKPRSGWKSKAEAVGFTWHHADGRLYWDERAAYAFSLAQVEERAGDCPARLILCGHTHTPRTRRLSDCRLVANPGSIGLQAYEDDHWFPHRVEIGSPQARYAMVEKGPLGWEAELIAVDYDFEPVAVLAEANGRPDWAAALRTGLMPA